jgi:hypothetical protein
MPTEWRIAMVTFGQGFSGLAGLREAGLVSAVALQGREQSREAVSSGWPAIDALLPAGGVRRGSLIEWLAGDAGDATAETAVGGGAATLACAVACRLAAAGSARGGMIVVVDRAGWFHPPAVLPWLTAARAGLPRAGAGEAGRIRLVVARPSRDDDEIWAIEQSLRCAGVAAVVAWPRLAAWTVESGRPHDRWLSGRNGLQQWTTALRRWQLAARSGGAVGLFVRSPAAIREPSWAEARFAVTSLAGGTPFERRLWLKRVGGGWNGGDQAAGRPVEIAIDLARGHAIPRPAGGASSGRRAGATAGSRFLPQGGATCRAS